MSPLERSKNVHAKGIVNREIKPANIFVMLSSGGTEEFGFWLGDADGSAEVCPAAVWGSGIHSNYKHR
jgi:hypothetical protein